MGPDLKRSSRFGEKYLSELGTGPCTRVPVHERDCRCSLDLYGTTGFDGGCFLGTVFDRVF